MTRYLLSALLAIFSHTVLALSVIDDDGKTIELDKPAERIITLAPSLTEMIYSINAENKLVATVEYSNYPEAAKKKPRIGNYERFVLERLISYKPDLVVAWSSANNGQQLKQLEKLNIPVYRSEPRELLDISRTIRNLGILTGQQQKAMQIANDFDMGLERLTEDNKNKRRLKAFYQVWHQPVYTVNGQHVISKIMRICGLKNIFTDAQVLAPKVTVESVIKRNPDMIIASGMATAQPEWLDKWRQWPAIHAVAYDNLFFIHPDLIQRQTVRLLDAARIMCQQADIARSRIKNRGQTH
jgi:iron complex transport system substrate-binding protein